MPAIYPDYTHIWCNYNIININHFWSNHIVLLILCLCFLWLDICAVRCCAAVPHFSSCLWPNLLGFSTKMKKFIWVTKMRSYISVLAAPCPCLTFLSIYKRAFIDFLIKRNSYQQKSGDISACQSWTVLVITAVSHISAADFTVPLSNHISQGKCFWYNLLVLAIKELRYLENHHLSIDIFLFSQFF